MMISSKTTIRFPPSVISTNSVLHPAINQITTAIAHRLLPPSLIRGAEVLLPPHASFSSVTTKPDEAKEVDTGTLAPRTLDSIFNHLWKTTTDGFPFERNTQISKLLREMDDLTQSRMDRWMLSPPKVKFPDVFFGDSIIPSLDIWKNGKLEEGIWTLPVKVPNIFEEKDISVNIVKDKSNDSYMLHILGRHEVNNSSETEKDVDTGGSMDNAPETKEATQGSKSDYQYDLKFQLPPLPSSDMTLEQAKDYYSPITAQFRKDESCLMVKIPESIVSLGKGVIEKVKDEHIMSVPVESAA